MCHLPTSTYQLEGLYAHCSVAVADWVLDPQRAAKTRVLGDCDSPARQHHRLSAMGRLSSNAGHMREVSAPLAAVKPVLPPLPDPHTLKSTHLPSLHNHNIYLDRVTCLTHLSQF